jgi:hypothetical protein
MPEGRLRPSILTAVRVDPVWMAGSEPGHDNMAGRIMVAVEFGHTSNPDKSGFASVQRLLNGYPEALGQAAKSPLPVYGVPGTVALR